MKIDKVTAFGYAYIHFAEEVMCFFVLYKIFNVNGSYQVKKDKIFYVFNNYKYLFA